MRAAAVATPTYVRRSDVFFALGLTDADSVAKPEESQQRDGAEEESERAGEEEEGRDGTQVITLKGGESTV